MPAATGKTPAADQGRRHVEGKPKMKVYAGATKQLPQQVNIGVDRKLDVLHAKLADRKPGLAACAQCYLDMYASVDFEGRVFRRVYPEIVGMCDSSPSLRGLAHQFYR